MANESHPLSVADDSLHWDEQGQPVSKHFHDVYFSKQSGIDESRYVFIKHNRLTERWERMPPHGQFSIGETGFGTGLNFLTTWQQWRLSAPASACLHFVSVEKYPLSRRQLQQALNLWPELQELAAQLLHQYPALPAKGFHRLQFDSGRVQLTLILDEAVPGLRQLLPDATAPAELISWAGLRQTFDAWFLDGFAPAKNPDMWTAELFQTMAALSGTNTSFATFTAAGVVKRALQLAGFSYTKVPGFGRKRHMLCGTYSGTTTRSAPAVWDSAWQVVVAAQSRPAPQALVIGAGLAGCHTARALAERGWQVTVLDKGDVASGASGNPQGVVYAKASSQDEPLTRFNLDTLQFACRYYGPAKQDDRPGFENCGAQTGVFYAAQTGNQVQEYRALALRYEDEPDFVRWVDPEQTQAVCGVAMKYGGLLFQQAGWVQPQRLCQQLLHHANITVQKQCRVHALTRVDDRWQARSADGHILAEAATAVIANATDALEFEQTQHLPLKAIRGQITQTMATAETEALRRVICGRGYIAPALATADETGHTIRSHCLGASYNLKDHNPLPDPADDQDNLAQVSELAPAFEALTRTQPIDSRASFRCATPDYLPVVGPAPAAAEMIASFAGFRRNAKGSVNAVGSYHPGLFVNLGHGSRGLAYTPLCAELLASMMTGAPLPVGRELALRLHPARFIVRNLKRNRL